MTTVAQKKKARRAHERSGYSGPVNFGISSEQLLKCPVQSLVASHWKENGTCRCKDIEEERRSERRLDSVEKILEGAYAAIEMISEEEVKILEQRFAIKSQLQQPQKQLGKHTTITLFVRGARETLHPLGKGL